MWQNATDPVDNFLGRQVVISTLIRPNEYMSNTPYTETEINAYAWAQVISEMEKPFQIETIKNLITKLAEMEAGLKEFTA